MVNGVSEECFEVLGDGFGTVIRVVTGGSPAVRDYDNLFCSPFELADSFNAGSYPVVIDYLAVLDRDVVVASQENTSRCLFECV